MSQRFFLIRHAETDWNKCRKLQGHSDIPLNSNGKKQSEILKRYLSEFFGKNLISSSIFSSDLLRAVETAKISMPESDPIKSRLLREMYLGDAEGQLVDDIQSQYGLEFWDRWNSSDLDLDGDLAFKNGESRKQGLDRIMKFLNTLSKNKNSNGNSGTPEVFFIFTHGLFIRTFTYWAVPGIEKQLHQKLLSPNCSLFEFKFNSENLFYGLEKSKRPELIKVHHPLKVFKNNDSP